MGLDLSCVSIVFALLAASCATESKGVHGAPVRNLDALLSEDPGRAEALERSLGVFLAEARTGDFTADTVDLRESDRHRFFYRRVGGYGETPGLFAPSILKAYTLNGEDYFVTVAFGGERDGAPFLDMIVELKATPYGDGYRFHCPFEDRTKDFGETVIDDVRFRYSGSFSMERAQEFMATRARLVELSGVQPGPLEYFAFQSLDELLKSHGLVFDEDRCNFLGYDLGTFDHGGQRYLTGMGDECYMYGYAGIFLRSPKHERAEMYGMMAVGFRTLFGGYWLLGTPMGELAEELRRTIEAAPDMDLVEIFKKGRNGQTLGHAPSLVMAALVCERALEEQGFDGVLRLVYSGSSGERFFDELEAVLGIDEAAFPGAVVEMLQGS